jgi:hypothetical protein
LPQALVLNFEFLYCDDNDLVWRAAQQAPITCSLLHGLVDCACG